MNYSEFIENKSQSGASNGFEPVFMPDFLFDFQKHLLEWALKKGQSAIFADTGLGKTPIQLALAENVVRKTNKKVLILTPLAVSSQTIKEGEKFGVEVKRSRDGKSKGSITVTNYQQLHKFDPNDYVCCVCDESSAIKNFTASTKKSVTRFMQKMSYRAFFTATPAPNDYIELGTTSEALGQLSYVDMLDEFFRDTSNDKNPQWTKPKYELLAHAEDVFWKWVSSWARAIKKPSDLGFSDDEFELPELKENVHILQCTKPLPGELFVTRARTLSDQRVERKLTVDQRIEKTFELVKGHSISVCWCHYNYEGDALEKELPNAVQVAGKDSDEEKEEKLIAFANSEIENLVIKPRIGAFGLNWQHCNHTVYFPSHSYEQFYQAIRRFWRYGQKRKVIVDKVTTEGELYVQVNIERKARQAEQMFVKLIQHMYNSRSVEAKQYESNDINLPRWIN